MLVFSGNIELVGRLKLVVYSGKLADRLKLVEVGIIVIMNR